MKSFIVLSFAFLISAAGAQITKMTNGHRLAHGLPPLSPRKLFSPCPEGGVYCSLSSPRRISSVSRDEPQHVVRLTVGLFRGHVHGTRTTVRDPKFPLLTRPSVL